VNLVDIAEAGMPDPKSLGPVGIRGRIQLDPSFFYLNVSIHDIKYRGL